MWREEMRQTSTHKKSYSLVTYVCVKIVLETNFLPDFLENPWENFKNKSSLVMSVLNLNI